MGNLRTYLAAMAAAGLLAGSAQRAFAMNLKTAGNQLILSGPVVDGDLERIKDALTRAPEIDTVILRNSPGGNIAAGYRTGELFRTRELTTAVSGYCYSSCSRMFLGGKSRVFTDDYPPEYTHVGFHGHYDMSNGRLLTKLVDSWRLQDWIIKHSDGKADPALVDRWIHIPVSIGMIHFYHPGLMQRDGASTFMCQGTEPKARSVIGCEPVGRTALDLGIVTSLTIVKSNDQDEVRAALPPRPKASGFAAVDDVAAVPMASEKGRLEYRRFLAAEPPRALALSPGGTFWAWKAGGFDAAALALSHCAQLSNQTCRLYAVDGDVVWEPN
jgi:hypothetical protein